jgi:hypothetical protein
MEPHQDGQLEIVSSTYCGTGDSGVANCIDSCISASAMEQQARLLVIFVIIECSLELWFGNSLFDIHFYEGHFWTALTLWRFWDLYPLTLEVPKKVGNELFFDVETRDGLVSRRQQNDFFRFHINLRFRC